MSSMPRKHRSLFHLLLACVPALVSAAGRDTGLPPLPAPAGGAPHLDLSIATPLLSLDLDYDLQLQERDAGSAAGLSQQITGILRSDTLAALGVDARVRSDARVRADGEQFRHRLDSVLERPLADVAVLTARYRLELEKAGADLAPVRRQSVLLRADGAADAGRLQWDGSFREIHSTDAVSAAGARRSILELRSSYRFIPALRVDLSSRALREWRPERAVGPSRDERRYGAGIHWEPLVDYRLAVTVDRLEAQARGVDELVASGSLQWTPAPAWNLELRYSEQLQQSGTGLLLEASIDLGGG